jgi:hypothetical protein
MYPQQARLYATAPVALQTAPLGLGLLLRSPRS